MININMLHLKPHIHTVQVRCRIGQLGIMVTHRNRAYVTVCGLSKLNMAVLLIAAAMVYAAAITSAACTRCGNSLYSEFEMEQGYTNFNHGRSVCWL